jgi:hypothetical protein
MSHSVMAGCLAPILVNRTVERELIDAKYGRASCAGL